MAHRSTARTVSVALAVMLGAALPAHAQTAPVVDADGRTYDTGPAVIPAPPPPMGPQYASPAQPRYDQAAWDQARADWLTECRANQRRDRRGNTIGGALIGGVAGGILGNVIAGRGDKTVGTVVGAVAGAAAGGAIGSSADRRQERRAMDYCESYLERHMGYYGHGYGQPGYGYQMAYQPMTVMVPVMMVQQQAVQPAPASRECKETQVIEEWVPVAGPAKRIIPRRPAPTKRIRVVPDKRIPLN